MTAARRTSRARIGAATAGLLALLALGCGDPVEGTLRSARPLEVPIEGGRACLMHARWEQVRQHRDGVSHQTETAYPSDVRFEHGGRSYAVTGDGGGRGSRTVYWHSGGEPLPPFPAWTRGAGDEWRRIASCASSQPEDACEGMSHLKIRWLPCDEPVELWGHIEGERFVLDRNAGVMAALGLFGGFMGCLIAGGVCAMVLPTALVGFLFWTRRKKARS